MRRVTAFAGVCALAIGASACANDTRRAERLATTTTRALPATTAKPVTTTATAPLLTDDASVTARAIESGERVTTDPNARPDAVRAAALTTQLAYRHVALLDPALEAAVSPKLPEDLRRALGLNVSAVRELTSLGRTTRSAPPDTWHITPVAPFDELMGYYRDASEATGVQWQVLAAVHLVETKLGRVVGDSSAGAQGPMQFLPATWARYGEGDIHSNRDSILAAARYLAANGAPSRLDDALYRYNPTSKYVNAVKAYATRMQDDPNAYRGYHEWQVLYRTVNGTLLLPEGWPTVAARAVAD